MYGDDGFSCRGCDARDLSIEGGHGLAVYVVVGICLAYFGLRKKLLLTLSSSLNPLIGNQMHGPVGCAVDLLAVFGTVFGVATLLGLGRRQRNTNNFRVEHLAFLRAPCGVCGDRAVQVARELLRDISRRLTLECDPDGILDRQ